MSDTDDFLTEIIGLLSEKAPHPERTASLLIRAHDKIRQLDAALKQAESPPLYMSTDPNYAFDNLVHIDSLQHGTVNDG